MFAKLGSQSLCRPNEFRPLDPEWRPIPCRRQSRASCSVMQESSTGGRSGKREDQRQAAAHRLDHLAQRGQQKVAALLQPRNRILADAKLACDARVMSFPRRSAPLPVPRSCAAARDPAAQSRLPHPAPLRSSSSFLFHRRAGQGAGRTARRPCGSARGRTDARCCPTCRQPPAAWRGAQGRTRKRPALPNCRAPRPVQRTQHRHRAGGAEVGLLEAPGPAMALAVDEHEGQVHILSGQRLLGDRALGVGEQRAQRAFESPRTRSCATDAYFFSREGTRVGRSSSVVQTSARGVDTATGVWDTSIFTNLMNSII